jgi:hypothetical protein
VPPSKKNPLKARLIWSSSTRSEYVSEQAKAAAVRGTGIRNPIPRNEKIRHLSAIFLSLVSTIILVLAIEGILYAGWRVTGATKLDTLYGNSIHWPNWRILNNTYPTDPENFLKIATFGGSSTEGASAARNFATAIDFLLREQTTQQVYVRNYGRGGAPFHRDQAEFARQLLPYYDIAVIYAGNNEWVNAYYESGGMPMFNIVEHNDPEPKRKQLLQSALHEIHNKFDLFGYLDRYSRIYAISWKILEKIKPHISSALKESRGGIMSRKPVRRARPSEYKKATEETAISMFGNLFADDLDSLRKQARKLKKTVIVVGINGDELWPPYFSVVPRTMAEKDVNQLNADLQRAESLINADAIDDAQLLLDNALEQAPKHAFANYLSGRLMLAKSDPQAAWKFLEIAVREDGFPHRALPVLNDVAAKIAAADTNDGFIFVDHVTLIRTLIAKGTPIRHLMADWMHPSTFNHVLIAYEVLCALSSTDKYSRMIKSEFCQLPASSSAAEKMRDDIHRRMVITTAERNRSMKAMYRWAVLLSRLSAHPSAFYKFAEPSLQHQYPDAKSNAAVNARVQTLRAVFTALRGGTCRQILDILQTAQAANPTAMFDAIKNPFPFPSSGFDIRQIFRNSGLPIGSQASDSQLPAACP